MRERDALTALLIAAGVDADLTRPLAHYGEMLLAANQRINLTGVEGPERLVEHLLDSLSIAPYVCGTLVDVGSGSGLPAVPLAIATHVPVTLVESTRKKAAFLKTVLAELSLLGTVIARRAEEAGRDPSFRERYACGTARAVASAPTVLELVVPFLAVGGVALLQRGKMDETERAAVADAAPMLGAEVGEEVALEGDRRILVIRKVTSTPMRFPRRTGIPEKRPLCYNVSRETN